MSSFISEIEKFLDWNKCQSRLPIAQESRDYDLEDAIADYSKWQPVYHPHRCGLRFLDDMCYSHKYISDSVVHHIQEITTAIMGNFSEYRNKYRIRYPLHLLLLKIIFAKQYGHNDAEEIADFYNERYLEFFILFPETPPFVTPLNATTIRTAMQLVSPDEAEKFFEEHFSKVKILIQEQIKYYDTPFCDHQEDIVDTISFEG